MGSNWKVNVGLVKFTGVAGTVGVVLFFFVLAVLLNITFAYLTFLLSRWAIALLFNHTITGWQFIAAVVLLGVVRSFLHPGEK